MPLVVNPSDRPLWLRLSPADPDGKLMTWLQPGADVEVTEAQAANVSTVVFRVESDPAPTPEVKLSAAERKPLSDAARVLDAG